MRLLWPADAGGADAGEMHGRSIAQPGAKPGDGHVAPATPKTCSTGRLGPAHPENGKIQAKLPGPERKNG